jgi:hypothetical protein
MLSKFLDSLVTGKKKTPQQEEKERIEKRLNILGVLPK